MKARVSPTPGFEWLHRTATIVLFVVLPGIVLVGLIAHWHGSDQVGFDLEHAYLPASQDVLDGESPYPHPGDPAVAGQRAYVYPPLVAVLLAPLTAVPIGAAIALGVVLTFVGCAGALALVGVRDWRCYTVALVWPPVTNSAMTVTVSVAVAVALAAAWRARAHTVRAGALLGCAAVIKPFAWPVALWPLLNRRPVGTAAAFGTALVLALGTWALIGFAGLGSYPDLLRTVSESEERLSYSLSGTLAELGLADTVARAVALGVAAALVAGAFVLGRRRDEARSFVALLLASLAATPIVWQHYLVVLLVALGICRPRFGPVWAVPLVLYVAPWIGNGDVWQTALVPLVVCVVGVSCLAGGRTVPGYSSSSTPGRSTSPSW